MRKIKFTVEFDINDAYVIQDISVESEKFPCKNKNNWKSEGKYSVCLTKAVGDTPLIKLIEALEMIEVTK